MASQLHSRVVRVRADRVRGPDPAQPSAEAGVGETRKDWAQQERGDRALPSQEDHSRPQAWTAEAEYGVAPPHSWERVGRGFPGGQSLAHQVDPARARRPDHRVIATGTRLDPVQLEPRMDLVGPEEPWGWVLQARRSWAIRQRLRARAIQTMSNPKRADRCLRIQGVPQAKRAVPRRLAALLHPAAPFGEEPRHSAGNAARAAGY